MSVFNLAPLGICPKKLYRNLSPSALYAKALRYDQGAVISDKGALILQSGAKTGRSPLDKRIVRDSKTESDIWWGEINIEMDAPTFKINRQRAIDYFNTRTRIYVVDGFAGWDPDHRVKVRVICTRPYHALFMHNMMIRPTTEELKHFGEPDYIIYNAGEFTANQYTSFMKTKTSIDLSFEEKEFVILGTEYAGEMKKGIFSIINYIMPKQGILSMHCSANEGNNGDVSLFFGLSGTGKTTLSADADRFLIGDDEHCWTDRGIFNIEGGCYAKTIDLTPEKEPEIFNAIKFGTVLENVVYDSTTHSVDYTDTSITQNTRASYPIEFIDKIKTPCIGGHPKNIIFLTCDAFGVLPPVSKLSPEQAMYHFVSGYTAKIAGTEMGITAPVATFSACFGAAFMVWHPSKYAELLAQKINEHQSNVWLVNTGWIGGGVESGNRIALNYTRAIIDAIHTGSLAEAPMENLAIFDFSIPTQCPNVPSELLNPSTHWKDQKAYWDSAQRLANLFEENFKQFADADPLNINQYGPKVASLPID